MTFNCNCARVLISCAAAAAATAAAAAAAGISGVTLAELEAELAADVEEEPAWELPEELREYRWALHMVLGNSMM
jgi:hypothetical protein